MSERFALRVERLASGGDGVGRGPDGRVVFVPGSCPGDTVEVRVAEAHRSFLRAELLGVLEPGPERVAPRCPLVGECGGCRWQHVSYAEQCRAKQAIVRDAYARIGGFAALPELEFHPCPAPYGYRARARLGFRDGVVGYRRERSHRLCRAERCPVLVPALERALAELHEHAPEGDGELTLCAGDDGEVCITGDGRPGQAIELRVAGDRVRVSPGVFCQANARLREPLALAVHEAVGTGARALELFAGAGYFTLGIARRHARVLVVESHGRATRDLAENLGTAGLENVEITTGLAERKLTGGRLADFAPEVVVLDPPRKGLHESLPVRIAALGARRIVYVACDPATQARDVRRLCERGYGLARLQAFDLFPQTPHVEVLAELRADGAPNGD